MVAPTDDKAIYFRFGTELAEDWETIFVRLEDRALYQVRCSGYKAPGGE